MFPLCKCPAHVVRGGNSRGFIWMEVRCTYVLCYTEELGSMHGERLISGGLLSLTKSLALLPSQFVLLQKRKKKKKVEIPLNGVCWSLNNICKVLWDSGSAIGEYDSCL